MSKRKSAFEFDEPSPSKHRAAVLRELVSLPQAQRDHVIHRMTQRMTPSERATFLQQLPAKMTNAAMLTIQDTMQGIFQLPDQHRFAAVRDLMARFPGFESQILRRFRQRVPAMAAAAPQPPVASYKMQNFRLARLNAQRMKRSPPSHSQPVMMQSDVACAQSGCARGIDQCEDGMDQV